ncbi:cold shock and DUF1294 domain-containing protein [Aestuariicella sp. G3-2]|nr:cold shock and DUF1294 domain-containing protein [Aestuariicella albida]
MKYTGTVTQWNADKGFGFIRQDNGRGKIFFHISNVINRQTFEGVGQSVRFKTGVDRQGRPCATHVGLPGEKTSSQKQQRTGIFSTVLAIAFLLFLAAATATHRLPLELLLLYATLSLMTFIAYALDKSAAKNNRWRTKESTLHLFALLGGWPGAVFAQQLLRHKSRKSEFRVAFWMTVILNLCVFVWFQSDKGASYQDMFISKFHQFTSDVQRQLR